MKAKKSSKKVRSTEGHIRKGGTKKKPSSRKPDIRPAGQRSIRSSGRIGIGCPGIKMFKLNQLEPADYNPRIIDNEAMEGLARSLSRFGCLEPIVVNTKGRNNVIVGGNQRYQALRNLGIIECLCVTVNCNKSEEKLLNLTLNNPKIQGQFTENLAAYIEELQRTLPEELATLDMRIAQLLDDIKINQGQKGQLLKYNDEKIKPYKKTHILLSFDPGMLIQIYEHLEALVKEPGVEYEQCSN